MWFGDLVTMKWWDDLWLNESFASYVAYLGLDALGDHEAWQDFHTRMKLWAYAEDQLPTTHRIANEVPSTDETFLNFDGITYGKGAATLKQLVRAVGPDAFRAGLRTYFRRHRFGNATLADFLAAIQEGSGADLVSWAARWLKTPSLNTLAVSWEADGETITRLELRQSAPENHPHLRPHHVDIGLLSAEGELATVPAVVEEVVADVPEAEGMAVPAFVYPNVGDHGYALVALDDRSVDFAMEGLASISDVLLRQQTWGALHEMVRDGSLSSLRFLQLVDRHLPGESSLPILAQLARLVPGTVARFVPEDEIDAAASRFVETARAAIDAAARDDLKVLWARALLGLVTTEADARLAAELIDHPPAGLQVDQDMRWSVAIRWSSLGLEGAAERVAAERERDPSDRGGRAGLTARASRPDAGVKQEVWDRIYGDGYESLTTMRAAAAGFWRRTQRDLLEGFIEPYFATLAEQFAAREVETGKALVTVFFPRHRVDEDMRAAISGVLDAGGVGPVLERLLVEVDDRLRRAIACRAVAAGDL